MTLTAPRHLHGRKCNAPRELIEERRAWIAEAARSGHGVKSIAAALHIGTRVVRDVLGPLDIPRGKPGAPITRAERVELVAAHIAAHEPIKRERIKADLSLTENAVAAAMLTLLAAGRAHSDGRGTYRAGPKPVSTRATAPEPAPAPKTQLRGVTLPPAPFEITPPDRDETLPRSAPISDARMVSLRQDRFLRSVQGWR